MSEVSLPQLRGLRERASVLLRNVSADLRPFVKKEDGTFRRTPESPSIKDDVNVTTTCSCLMALAVTNSFKEFYKAMPALTAPEILRSVVEAPWMSSGLTANNAFTTTLVLRTFGFLEAEGLLKDESGKSSPISEDAVKNWDLQLGITAPIDLAIAILERADSASDFLWLSLSDKTRELLKKEPKDGTVLKSALALDLARIIEGGWIFEEARFDKASATTKQRLTLKETGYKLAEANRLLLVDQYPTAFAQPTLRSLSSIAALIAEDPNNFSINKYPPSAAVLYWFVDAIARAKIALSAEQWERLCIWAANQFNHEQSLVVADHDAMMNPIAMAMSACLCSRLRDLHTSSEIGPTKHQIAVLPSLVELERSITALIQKQTPSGIWNKYFPLFHYQDAGSNFCFTFELLEAILHEFGRGESNLLRTPNFISGLEKAVTWCERNRYISGKYTGWNSGGDLTTLEKEQPESWSTGVVHMFLWEVVEVISRNIQSIVLRKYNARPPKPRSEPETALKELLDIELFVKGKATTVTSVLKTRIVDKYKGKNEVGLRRNPSKNPLSALLFGPPGTSKTEVTRAVADDLNWPLIEITPSEFVKGNLANVYLKADEIFQDLMDLSGVVVFFDEMDALVQTRDSEVHLDIASQFLTTTMLPKLTGLHDQGRVVFFMATNFQDRFDAAIKRPGRFDLLLCMGPPKLREKLDRPYRVFSLNDGDPENAELIQAGKLIEEYLKNNPDLRDRLALYTFGEYKTFLKAIGDKKSIRKRLEELKGTAFRKLLKADSEYVTLKLEELGPLRDALDWKGGLAELAKKKFNLKELEKKKIPITLVVRFVCDRQESREQH